MLRTTIAAAASLLCLCSLASSAEAAGPTQPAAAMPGNRVAEFCKAAPAPTVVRAKLHADTDLSHVVEVECVYGKEAPTEHMAQKFFGSPEDETLLVSLEKDGNVVGTAWPVFKEKVSLEFGIPDMTEVEAVTLLQSPRCQDELRAFRDRGIRPIATAVKGSSPGGGCAHCMSAPPSSTTSPFDLLSVGLLGGVTLLLRRAVRGRSRRSA